MSAFARVFPAFGLPGLPSLAPARVARRVLDALAKRDAAWRARQAMRGLDDRALRDIGVSRGDLDAMLREEAGRLGLFRDRGDQVQH